MSQNDFNIANQGFPSFRSDLNSALLALGSNSSGATAPATTYAYQWWYDTANDILKFRNADNDAWIDFATFDQATDSWSFTSVDINGGTIDGTVIGGTTAAAISGTTGAFSGDVTLPSINGGPLAGFRNAIINGNFDHWQRGTSLSGAGYLADRWFHNVAGPSGTVTQSRQVFTIGQTDVPNEPTYFYRIQGSSYTMTAGNVTQKIEDVRTFAGQTVTVSFYAKASAPRELGVRFLQVFDGSAGIITLASPVSLTTSWQKFTRTVSIPSIAGKTVGASSRLELVFDIKEGAVGSDLGNDSIDIAQVQLEAGDTDTPFEHRSYGQELALCQRYFEVGGGHGVSYASSGVAIQRGEVYYRVSKRATVTLGLTKTGGVATGPVNTAVFPSLDGFVFGFSSTAASQDIVITYTADAEL